MRTTFLEVFFELPKDRSVTGPDLLENLRTHGLFGYIDWSSSDDNSVRALISTRVDHGVFLLPTFAALAGANGHDLQAREHRVLPDAVKYIGELSDALGVHATAWLEAGSDEIEVPSNLDVFNSEQAEFEAGDRDEDLSEADRDPDGVTYLLLGRERLSIMDATAQNAELLANEIALDIKSPVTAWDFGTGYVVFARDGVKEVPMWTSRKPVIEVHEGERTLVRWFSATKKATGSLSEKLAAKMWPREVWSLNTGTQEIRELPYEPINQPAELEIAGDPKLGKMLRAQEALKDVLEAVELESDVEEGEARALAGELGLDQAQSARLVEILEHSDAHVDLEELFALFGVPSEVARVHKGMLSTHELPSAVTVDRGSLRAALSSPRMLERPTGPGFFNAMHRLDFDQPALALCIEVAMVVVGCVLIFGRALEIPLFDNTAVMIAGLVVGATLMLDGLFSINMWRKIQRGKRS